METDTESTLQEYQIQLEQVDIALKSDPDNEELLKLKADLNEIIELTKDLISEERSAVDTSATSSDGITPSSSSSSNANAKKHNWKSADKCMAIYRIDGKYYSATVDQVLDDGTCTVVFDGYSNTEITQVGALKPRNKNSNTLLTNPNDYLIQSKASASSSSQVGHKKAFTKKELELKLKEAKKRKKEKFALKLKAMDEISEKQKKNWNTFNSKLSSKTWKGVVKKNKFETPIDHENKIGVGTNSAANRIVAANGTILPTNSTVSAAAAAASALANSAKTRHTPQSYRTSMFSS
jgi:survival-of-motor-neuron-related-splicing factor 30